MSLQVTGQIMLFRSQYGYSTSIANKNQEGNYEYMRIDVSLPRGTELENKTKINVTNGFLSFYKTKDGLAKIKLVVLEYQDQYEQEEREAIQNEVSYNELQDDMLPF